MLLSQNKWKFTYDENAVLTEMESEIALSPLTKRLLRQREITSAEQARRFLQPDLKHLHKPGLLHDIEKAAERVKTAVKKQEPILVFGDYDADGVSSTAVMLEALTELGAICDFYIPNRFTEGYGPNKQAFTQAAEQGYKLIITVDTGIAAMEEAELATQLGLDLIITDHHEIQEVLPKATAVVHPKCSTDYPFQELAGVGVAFKFAHYLLGYFPEQLLDLVVLGTVADLVPLRNENRVLVYHGLKAINKTKRPGIKALKKAANIDKEITEEDIGFLLGPRLNAVGRLQDADLAVELLLTNDAKEAEEMASFIENLNIERQRVVASIEKEAEEMVTTKEEIAVDNVIVVAKQGWNEGVLGIVASKLVRKFDRPAIVLAINPETGRAKGSARSIDAFDLFKNCMKIKEEFIHFGGHAQAAGMTLLQENINSLREKLHQAAAAELSAEDYKQSLLIDSTIDPNELSIELIEEIGKLGPFGMANPKPLFHMKTKPSDVRLIGSQKNHLKFGFSSSSGTVDGIAFGLGDNYPYLSPRSEIEFVGELGINEWNGNLKVQLMIKDMAVNEWQLFDYRGLRNIGQKLPVLNPKDTVIVRFRKNTSSFELNDKYPEVHYSSLQKETADKKHLILTELPDRLKDLSDVLNKTQPDNIYACYNVKDEISLNSIPSREDFKWFYGMMVKNKRFNMEGDFQKLAKLKGWKEEKVSFISQVFNELEFVQVENGVVKLAAAPSKRDLSESSLYQKQVSRLEIEAVLYYSSYQELKEWISLQITENGTHKEEVIHGL